VVNEYLAALDVESAESRQRLNLQCQPRRRGLGIVDKFRRSGNLSWSDRDALLDKTE
jgi:hypothetical protein